MEAAEWLFLIHNLPPKPPYLRAKVMRRLTQLGALALKRSIYLLPVNESTLEDFQWLRQEIGADGGDAWIVQGRFAGGLRDEEIREQFRTVRAAEYRTLAAEARSLLERLRERGDAPLDPALDADRRRLGRRVEAARRHDFFQADGREELEVLMSTIERLSERTVRTAAQAPAHGELRARTWVTRSGVKVDRMASAWLIRRFIDPAGTFVFVGTGDPMPAGALRFDMFEGEFTHDGDRCTFEVLLEMSGRTNDKALDAIGQIVHDIDLREDRFQRPETAGLSALVDGIAARYADDHRRLAESAPIFDALYASLGGSTTSSSTGA